MKKSISVLFLILISTMVFSANISGTVFEWYTLEPLSEAIIEINTIPSQTEVAVDGTYSFEVPEGNYILTANYYENNYLKYSAIEEIVIKEEGNFTIDIIMLPSLEENEFLFEEIENISIPETTLDETENNFTAQLLIIAFAIIFTIILFFWIPSKIAKTTGLETERIGIDEKLGRITGTKKEQETKSEKELEEVIGILRRYGGRMTQLELREKVDYGEAKTSLIVAELVDSGRIKKFKKGRGNILVLQE